MADMILSSSVSMSIMALSHVLGALKSRLAQGRCALRHTSNTQCRAGTQPGPHLQEGNTLRAKWPGRAVHSALALTAMLFL